MDKTTLSVMYFLVGGLAWGVQLWWSSSPDQVCYGDLGCFTNGEPHNNARGKLPESPKKQNISFLLYTKNHKVAEFLNASEEKTLSGSHFNSTKNTKIIVHGMGESALDEWPQELKDAILNQDDVNVIVVNWHDGAGTITNLYTYIQAVANTRVVGAVIAKLILSLKTVMEASFRKIHLIGHSLGGHVVGYAGKRINKLARITGLDPANLMFDGYGPQVGLAKSDAEFVDVVHTDTSPVYKLGFGTDEDRGDADFYPNSGSQLKTCGRKWNTFFKLFTGDFWGAVTVAFCSHVQSVTYFISSVRGANYTACPCASNDDFDNGKCTKCPLTCLQMGYYADKGKTNGKFYLLV